VEEKMMKPIRRQVSKYQGLLGLLSLSKPKPMSLGSILEAQAAKRPEHPAILYEERVINYRAFNEAANRYAHLFMQKGFKKGDVIALLMDNRPEYFMAVAGLAKLGVVISLINTGVRGRVLAHAVNICDAQTIIIGNELLPAFAEVYDDIKLQAPAQILVEDDNSTLEASVVPYENLNPLLAGMPISNPATTASIDTDDLLYYIYTSGTTGFPKATASKHQNWVALGHSSGGLGLQMLPEDILYNCLPLYHNSGCNIAFACFMMHGSTIALRRKFSARNFWRDINKYQATHFIYIGELCRYLNNQPLSPDDRNNTLEYILGNGMRGEYWQEFKERFGIKHIFEVYGATEGVARIINLKEIPGMMGSLSTFGIRCGEVIRYDVENECILKDAQGRVIKCQPGETGLLLAEINGRSMFAGYVNNPEATEAKIMRNVFKEGDQYFHTGDLVKLQTELWVSFVDRLGDTYRWKGENVSTNEVADILNSFGKIEDSNVYGVQVPGTEGRCGMVALKVLEGETLDLQAFAQHVIRNLAGYARPYFLRFRDEIDSTNSFKQIKTQLQKEGFDPALVKDPLYFLDPQQANYISLQPDVYEAIIKHEIAF